MLLEGIHSGGILVFYWREVMSNVVANIDHITHTGIDKTRIETKKPKHIAKKILRLLSIDAEGFCESKDWPYLWPIKKNNSK